MYNTVTELFLSTYFSINAVIGKFVGDMRGVFDRLYAAFLLPQDRREETFAATQADVVREMKTYGDYAQVCRIREFFELSEDEGIPAEFEGMIAVKGCALKKIKQFGFDEFLDGTETSVGKFLSDAANIGFVPLLCTLGVLQCEGVFVPRNEKLGRKNLNKAAAWNCVEGILLALFYDENGRQRNLNRLYTVTVGSPYDGLCAAAQRAYALGDAKSVLESKLLKKAFGAGTLKAEAYDSQHARFLFSEVLSFKDKERVLFSGHKELIAETADLPLKLTCGELGFDARALENLPLSRPQERSRICDLACGTDMRTDPSYRPLCVCGDSEYLLGLYASAIKKAFPSAHVERIDVADLSDYDFEPTKNHVFVRSCDEDGQNVYLLSLKGDIRESVLGAVKNFLQSFKRKKFRLQHPSAVIDLSAILPICFCDRQNARELKSHCDVVTLAPVSQAEKPELLNFIVRKKAEKYRMTDLQLDRSARSLLAAYSVEKAEIAIDRAVRYARGRAALTVTAETLKDVSGGDTETQNRYGFGGAGNENK